MAYGMAIWLVKPAALALESAGHWPRRGCGAEQSEPQSQSRNVGMGFLEAHSRSHAAYLLLPEFPAEGATAKPSDDIAISLSNGYYKQLLERPSGTGW